MSRKDRRHRKAKPKNSSLGHYFSHRLQTKTCSQNDILGCVRKEKKLTTHGNLISIFPALVESAFVCLCYGWTSVLLKVRHRLRARGRRPIQKQTNKQNNQTKPTNLAKTRLKWSGESISSAVFHTWRRHVCRDLQNRNQNPRTERQLLRSSRKDVARECFLSWSSKFSFEKSVEC